MLPELQHKPFSYVEAVTLVAFLAFNGSLFPTWDESEVMRRLLGQNIRKKQKICLTKWHRQMRSGWSCMFLPETFGSVLTWMWKLHVLMQCQYIQQPHLSELCTVGWIKSRTIIFMWDKWQPKNGDWCSWLWWVNLNRSLKSVHILYRR